MANLNALAFEIGIKESKTSELDSIQRRLEKLSGKTITIDVKGVAELNQLLNRLGHDSNGFTFKLPDLSQFMEQVKSVKNVTDSLFSKQNAGDIPAFQSALSQMRELSAAISKLKNENLSLQTGHGSDLYNRIQKMGTALNSAFSELPNVKIQSMSSYMKELTAEYLRFINQLENRGGFKNFSKDAQTEIQRVMRIFDQLNSVGTDASALKVFQQQVRAVASIIIESLGNVIREINAVKSAIQRDNFSAMSERINKAAESIKILDENFQKFHLTIAQDEGMRNFMTGLGEVIRNVRATMNSINLNGVEGGATSLTSTIKSIERAKFAMYELDKLMSHANTAVEIGGKFGGDTSKLTEQINLMKQFRNELEIISQTGSFNGKSASDYLNTAEFKIAKDTLSRLVKEQERWNAEMQKSQGTAGAVSQTIRQLSNEEERLAQAIRKSIGAGREQSQVLSDLRSMMMQYLSVYGAQQFVKEMAQITGELELQQKSLEVIIGSAATAQQLYGQIRDLSQMSPYTFQDLIKSTRQLAAFNIDTPQLYDTMKALTDIGAGLSVDVQRLILAFGHVKAYGYLSGIQNRQFETAGIDLMGELVKYYNNQADEAEKQGKVMERVTRKSLYGRMRKRDIPFEDVQNVILGLDKEGGQFYNMQIRQFETLGGKLRNLRNNYNIMMSEMGKANHGFLTSGVDAINEITENWRTYYNIIMDVVWGLGAAKVAMLAYNGLMGKQAVATYGSLMAQMNREAFQRSQVAAMNNMWAYTSKTGLNHPTRYELGRSSYNVKGLTSAHVQEIVASKELTATQKMQIALRNNLSKAARAQILASAGVNAATIREINSMSAYNRTMLRVQLSLRAMQAEMKATMLAMAANPMTWIFAAVTAVTALVTSSREARAKIDDLSNSTGEAARQDASALTDFLDKYSDIFKRNSEGSVSRGGVLFDIDKAAIEAHGVNQVLDAFMEKIQDMSPIYKGDLFDIQKFDKQIEQAEEAARKLAAMETAKNIVGGHQSLIADLNAQTGGWGTGMKDALGGYGVGFWGGALHSEEFGTNAKDFAAELNDNLTTLTNVNKDALRTFFQENEAYFKQVADEYGLSIEKDRDAIFRRWLKALPNSATSDDRYNFMPKMPRLRFGNAYYGEGAQVPETIWKAFTSEKQLREARQNMEDQIPTIVRGIYNKYREEIANLPKDQQSDVFGYVLHDYMNKLFEQEKMTDPKAQMQVINSILLNSLGQGSDFDSVINQLILRDLGAKTKDALGSVIDENSKFSDDKVQAAIRQITSDLGAQNWLWNQALKNLVKDTPRIFEEAFNEALKTKSPYQMLWQELAGNEHKLGDTTFNSLIKSCETFTDWVDKSKKKYKELKEEIDTNALHIKVKADFQGGSAATFAKYMQEKFGVDVTKDNAIFDFSAFEKNAGISFDEARSHYKNMIALEGYEAYAKAEGIDLSDKNKNKGGSKSYHDEFAKRWDERIRILKEAYGWYDKWEKKIGNDAAINEVNNRYGDIFDEWRKDPNIKLRLDVDTNDIANYQKYVKQIRDDALTRYQQQKGNKKFNNGEQALRVYRQAEALLNDISFDDFTRTGEEFVSLVNKGMDDMLRKWDIFNNVRTATGNKNLAMQLAGFSDTERSAQNSADTLKAIISSQLGLMGDEVKIPITFDADKSEKQIRNMFEAAIGGSANYRDQIEGLINEYKKWSDLQKEVQKTDADVFARLISSVQTYSQKLKAINTEYEKQLESIQRQQDLYISTGGKQGISKEEADTATGIATSKRDLSIMELRPEIQNFYNAVTTMNRNLAVSIANELKAAYLNAFENGFISAQEYNDKMKAIYDNLNETRSWNSNRSIYERIGGLFFNPRTDSNQADMSAAANNVRDMIDVEQSKGDQADMELLAVLRRLEQALNNSIWGVGGRSERKAAGEYGQIVSDWNNSEKVTPEKKTDTSKKATKEKEKKDEETNDISSFKKFTDDFGRALNKTIKTIGDFQKGLDFASGLFQSMGLDGAATVAGDAAGVLGSTMQGASSLSMLGPYGMAAGAALGFAGGLFQLHDKALQREIERLRAEVTKIENNTALILQSRERQLGYDDGSVRRSYSEQYAPDAEQKAFWEKFLGGMFKNTAYGQGFASQAQKAMYEYYQYNSAGTGYEQQLANLRKEREDYMAMYNAEYDKKDSSDEALEEYKKKIAELDDEIHYFAVDLANELWDIDLKGWAQQLSDALTTAFENGTDMAKAYNEAVTAILQNLASKMMQLAIIEPMMERLQTKLFGIKDKNGNWKGGVFNIDDPTGSAKKVTDAISEFFGAGGEGQKTITAAKEFLTAFEQGVENAGLTLLNHDQTSLSNGLQGTSEETSSLLAAYVNALRQDVAVKRILLTQFVQEYWPSYIAQITGIRTVLDNIDQNVAMIVTLLSLNGELFNRIDDINTHLERFSTGIEKIHVQ